MDEALEWAASMAGCHPEKYFQKLTSVMTLLK
jgi:hypothetical protein